MKTAQSWYAPKSSNHQGTIVNEGDGRTVAVAYDKADAPLIAAAPELLEALQTILSYHDKDEIDDNWQLKEASAAIAKARGEG